MGSFKTVLKSIRPFFVDRLARNVHFNTNPIGWFLLNQPIIQQADGWNVILPDKLLEV